MADMQSRVRHVPDVDPAAVLRDISAAALTATGNETGVQLNTLTQAYWDGNEQTAGTITVQVIVPEVDRTTGDETYQLFLQVTDAAGSNETTIAQSPVLSAPAAFVLVADGEMVQTLIPVANRARLRMRAVLAGTTPIMRYGAYYVGAAIAK